MFSNPEDIDVQSWEKRKTRNRQEGISVAHFDASEKLSACIGLRNAGVSNSKCSVELVLFLFPSFFEYLMPCRLLSVSVLVSRESRTSGWEMRESERYLRYISPSSGIQSTVLTEWKSIPETKRGERQLKTERENVLVAINCTRAEDTVHLEA